MSATSLKMRYTWEAFDPEKVVRSVSCMVTEGLRKKLLAALTGQRPTASQYVGRVRVVLQDGVSLALFDRIVLIDKGKPLALGERVELEHPARETHPLQSHGTAGQRYQGGAVMFKAIFLLVLFLPALAHAKIKTLHLDGSKDGHGQPSHGAIHRTAL